MPITIVSGGQWGSEGKGKVADWLAQQQEEVAVVRVGGPNSGHNACIEGIEQSFRQLPACAPRTHVKCFLPAGALVYPPVLLDEVRRAHAADRLVIDPDATVITEDDVWSEGRAGHLHAIASTLSGTGSAVANRVQRKRLVRAVDIPELRPFVGPTTQILRDLLRRRVRVIIEGTQGYGLSVLHGHSWPHVTSRDTTAAGALSEVGLSPLDVDRVVLVLRSFPIRVGGPSGPIPREISWSEIAERYGHDHSLQEYTTVTHRLRRVAEFDPSVVAAAIAANAPTDVVLNHVDLVDHDVCRSGEVTPAAENFARRIESSIDRTIDWLGTSPGDVVQLSGEVRTSVSAN